MVNLAFHVEKSLRSSSFLLFAQLSDFEKKREKGRKGGEREKEVRKRGKKKQLICKMEKNYEEI